MVRTITGPAKFGKLIVSLVGAVASTAAALGITGGHLTNVELVNLAIAAVAAFQVWYITETRDNPSGKAVIAGLAAALAAVQTILVTSGHIPNTAAWIQIGIAALSAAGVMVTPGNLRTADVYLSGQIKTALTGKRKETSGHGVGPIGEEPGSD